LEVVNKRVAAANREQAEFTYSVSHDLRAPTNTMRMLIDELEEHDPDTDRDRVVADMKRTNDRMGQLIKDVLSYSRMVGEDLETDRVDLNELVDGVLQDLAAEIAAAGAEVSIDHLPDIQAHPMQIRMLFQNVISNAVKFHSPGASPRVEISASTADGHVVVTVADDGIGIPDAYREDVFGLFKRLHSRAEFDGSGLGLTICRRVMTNHSGSISLSPRAEGGTLVDLVFPDVLERDVDLAV